MPLTGLLTLLVREKERERERYRERERARESERPVTQVDISGQSDIGTSNT